MAHDNFKLIFFYVRCLQAIRKLTTISHIVRQRTSQGDGLKKKDLKLY